MRPSGTRLFAFFGLVPLGAFLVVHAATTSTATSGAARFSHVFTRTPILTSAVMLVVMAPLVAHAGWGTWVALTTPRPAELPGWRARLRRVAAFATLAFLLFHVATISLPDWLGRVAKSALAEVATGQLSSTWHSLPVVALAYLAGTAATLFHFGSAAWATFRSSGLLVSEATSARVKWGLALVCSVLFVVFTNTIVYLATGTRLVGSAPAFVPDGPPPAPCTPKS